MSIPYNTGIPASTHNPSVDQPNMLTNTNSIATYVAVDHVAFNTSGSGQHNQVTFNNVTSQSTPSNPAAILYTKNDAFSIPQLNFLNSQAFPLTAASSGSVLLFGGIIMQWGTGTATSAGTSNSFVQPFPNNCWMVVMSIQSSTVSSLHSVWCSTDPPSKTAFTAKSDSGTLKIAYIAIGN